MENQYQNVPHWLYSVDFAWQIFNYLTNIPLSTVNVLYSNTLKSSIARTCTRVGYDPGVVVSNPRAWEIASNTRRIYCKINWFPFTSENRENFGIFWQYFALNKMDAEGENLSLSSWKHNWFWFKTGDVNFFPLVCDITWKGIQANAS